MPEEPFRYNTMQPIFKDDGSTYLAWTPPPYETIVKQIAEAIANDCDDKIKRALVELGWTPPPEE